MNHKCNLEYVDRIVQGDIIRNVEYIESVEEHHGNIEITKIVFPQIIVLTQECDLQWDFKSRRDDDIQDQDKYLLSVIVAPLYNADHVFAGTHLEDLEQHMKVKSSAQKKLIKNNETPRYHYIEFQDEDHIAMVPSIIDFKHYFSVNAEYLVEHKKTNFICSICPIFRERISQRFANFLARIGLPE